MRSTVYLPKVESPSGVHQYRIKIITPGFHPLNNSSQPPPTLHVLSQEAYIAPEYNKRRIGSFSVL